MNMIKNEVKTDFDSEMARVLREKEELERKLSQVRINNNNDVAPPSYWAYQYNENQTFYVDPNTNEYYNIQNAFNRSMRNRITRIDRIQNKPLWSFFSLKKNVMQNSHGHNERFLFHGSKTNAYDIIVRDGFDHRVSNMNGALGAGIYFASDSSTSSTYVNGYQKKCFIAESY